LPLLGWIVLFTAVGGIASAAFAGLFLLYPKRTGLRMLPHFVSFATGALIGAALLGLLPEAMQSVGPGGAHAIGTAWWFGLGVFFIIEKLVLWRHAHSHEHEDPGEREVAARGVMDTPAHNDGAEDRDVPGRYRPAPHSVAFAGNVAGQPTVLSDVLAPSQPANSRRQGEHSHDHGPLRGVGPISRTAATNRSTANTSMAMTTAGTGTVVAKHGHDHGGHGHDHSRDGARVCSSSSAIASTTRSTEF